MTADQAQLEFLLCTHLIMIPTIIGFPEKSLTLVLLLSFGLSLQSGVATAYHLSPSRPIFNVRLLCIVSFLQKVLKKFDTTLKIPAVVA